MELFSQYKELFSGSLGEVHGVKVEFNVKDSVVPFHSRPYSGSKAFEELTKKEVQDLIDLGVLIKNV